MIVKVTTVNPLRQYEALPWLIRQDNIQYDILMRSNSKDRGVKTSVFIWLLSKRKKEDVKIAILHITIHF